MPQSTIQALYNRTLQSYCMAAGVAASGNTFPWARISLQQQDTRGGRISASGSLPLIIDGRIPETRITSVSAGEIFGPDQVIGGEATDNRESGVGKVEVSVDNGPWLAATGAEAWSFSLAGYTGDITLRARATDQVGNVGNPFVLPLRIDTTGPNVTIDPILGTLKPTKNTAGQWQVRVRGRAEDQLARTKAGSVVVQLTQQSGVGVAQSQQIASGEWDINYLLDASLYDPTGSYTITVRAEDNVGNPSNIATGVVRLDANGPVANLNPIDTARELITQTLTIGGVVSDTNSIAGIDRLEIAFTPIEQVAALPGDSTSTAAEALLNRTWRAVTLAQRGAGITTTNWSFPIPADLENSYQIDLRGTDMLGNISITASIWRGIIDTTNPRVVMTAAASGASYFDVASNQPLYEIRFVCGAQDRNLDETGFTCPGEGLAEPVRTFANQPVLQNLFPDLTIRRGLAISYTRWLPTTTPAATMSACDSFGRCAQASTASTGSAAGATVTTAAEPVEAVEAAAAPTVPQAMIVNPTTDSFVAASTVMSVTVAAEAGAGLKDVTISLDNTIVQTLSFAQAENVTRVLRTVSMPVANEGLHTLVAQATAWDNASQTTLSPVVFTLDTAAPTVTIDASTLTLADTWQPESGVLRFNGTASDSVGLATVQIREAGAPGANSFADATFGSGTWRVALPVPDPEGRTLNITVRAIDRAGRISETTQNISTDLSAADAPDTSISSGPANPSSDNFATFAFAGSASAVAFDCQLDDGVYTPCASPTSYNDLSKGSHTLRVRAIDSRGLADLSPAEQTWTVNASALDVNMTSTPSNTPVVPTNTPTNTPVGPTDTPTNTPVVPTNTPTNTPVGPTNTPTNTPVVPTDTPTNTPVGPTATPVGVAAIVLSSAKNGTARGLSYRDEDIIQYNPASGQWTLVFDGSDVGLGDEDVDAFAFHQGVLLLSVDDDFKLAANYTLNNQTLKVEAADILAFVPTQLGNTTQGKFQPYLQGDSVGLDSSGENIDAITFDAQGNLLVSVTGGFKAGGVKGDDEDLFAFDTTTHTWSLYFDGARVGLTQSGEDVRAAWADPTTSTSAPATTTA